MAHELRAEDFSAFFRAVRGYEPFPWQRRLARLLAEGHRWPAGLALPTGSGKTSTIDVAVFSLALALAQQTHPRRAPMRIVFVVDRRIIVDAAYDAAMRIQVALRESGDDVVVAVREALQRVARPGFPALYVARLRGGMPREADWTPSPSHPTVLLSTVDQVGSRLLFRGYGVSESMRPVHAGLLGADALILLDEVHLSEPFRQTLRSIEMQDVDEALPWRTVELSATPRVSAAELFTLDDADRADETLRMRLGTRKPAILRAGRGREGTAAADEYVDEALRATPLGEGMARRVLVVVNRVDLARRIHDALQARLSSDEFKTSSEHHLRKPCVELLIGRARDADRTEIVRRIIDRTAIRSSEALADEDIVFLVATQTVEAGADLDFDAVVSQIAPVDSLRQRFGRLDRAGWSTRSGRWPKAVIIASPDDVARGAVDPIYGEALRSTWEWLRSIPEQSIDFGSDAIGELWNAITSELRDRLTSPAVDAPILMPSHVGALERTRPTPVPDPAIDLWLHGPRRPADVSIVWRADVPEPSKILGLAERVTDILDSVPPKAAEALQLPIWTVRSWMTPQMDGDWRASADVGDAPQREPDRSDPAHDGSCAWRWSRAQRRADVVRAEDIRPGDLLVVPSSRGGCDRFGWDARSYDDVRDIADLAAAPYRASSDAARLHPRLLQQEFAEAGSDIDEAEFAQGWNRIAAAINAATNPFDLVEAALDAGVFPESGATSKALLRLRHIRQSDLSLISYPRNDLDESGCIVLAARGSSRGAVLIADPHVGFDLDATTEDDERSALSDGSYTLIAHGQDVEGFAREGASKIGLADVLVADLALAGHLHDVGKADPRFQDYLRGSRWTRYEAVDDEPLAKSLRPRDRRSDRLARRAADLPNRWRHEALSVRAAIDHRAFAQAVDPELVLWLIGVHHGWGRPSFPHADPLEDRELDLEGFVPGLRLSDRRGPQDPTFVLSVIAEHGVLNASWSRLRLRVSQRYGPWRLALFESIVRLADHRASAEQRARQETTP